MIGVWECCTIELIISRCKRAARLFAFDDCFALVKRLQRFEELKNLRSEPKGNVLHVALCGV